MSQVVTVPKDKFLEAYNRASCAEINGDMYHIYTGYVLDVDENGDEIICHAFSASGFDVVIPVKETWLVDPIYYNPTTDAFTLGASDGEVPPFVLYEKINMKDEHKMRYAICYDIQWDTSDNSLEDSAEDDEFSYLPKALLVPFPAELQDEEDLITLLTDSLTETSGFCVNTYEYLIEDSFEAAEKRMGLYNAVCVNGVITLGHCDALIIGADKESVAQESLYGFGDLVNPVYERETDLDWEAAATLVIIDKLDKGDIFYKLLCSKIFADELSTAAFRKEHQVDISRGSLELFLDCNAKEIFDYLYAHN